jgi:membrane peptidoglycan carboxypeptidase
MTVKAQQREHIRSVLLRRRGRKREQHQQNRQSVLVGAIAFFVVAAGLVGLAISLGILVIFGVYVSYARELPPPSAIAQVRQQFETTLLYERTGQTVIYQVVDPAGDRQSAPLPELPPYLVQATIAIEDKSFYENIGFDIRGISRAVVTALQGGQIQGASTITQQLVKNVLIDPEERTAISADRKIKEIILAAEISRLYSKDQILEWYLNTNFYGNLAYGVGTAAQVYFGKRAQDLTLGEAAMLAAIPQNPQLNPIDNWIAARQRQAVVLDSMQALGMISAQQAEVAKAETIILRPTAERYGIIAPHFSLYARQQAESILNDLGYDGSRLVLGGGLRIYTTLDLDLFYQSECAMRAYVIRITGGPVDAAPNTSTGTPCVAAAYLPMLAEVQMGIGRPVTNAAAVIIEPNTGEIKTIVGSLDYYNAGIQGSFNAALGLRQPASAFKPFVYLTAFASENHDYTPAKMVLDIPSTFNSFGTAYTPRNENNQFHGVMNIRKALANSYNIPTVRVLQDVTIGQVLRRARLMGLSTLTRPLDQYGLALALGSGEVTLTDLTYAYTNFANLGYMAGKPVKNPRPGFRGLDPVSVLRIEDRDGKVLWQYDERDPRGQSFQRQNVVNEGLAYLITDILSDNDARLPAFGPDNALALSRPAAAKTGTTNDNRDAWTLGYTPFLVTGVWVGNNNNAPMSGDMSGSTAAAPIWHAIMEYAHNRDALPATGWQRPSTVQEALICAESGLAPTNDCPKTKELFYVDQNNGVSTIPTQTDFYWRRYRINNRTGLLATANTPPDLVAEQVYFDYPEEMRAWAVKAGLPLPPTEYDSGGSAVRETATVAAITSPVSLANVRDVVEIRGNLSPSEVIAVQLEYGIGINPATWFPIKVEYPDLRGDDLLLARWDAGGLNGLYTLRLGVTLTDKSFQTRTLQVIVVNPRER